MPLNLPASDHRLNLLDHLLVKSVSAPTFQIARPQGVSNP
jgi:hypothetical protein